MGIALKIGLTKNVWPTHFLKLPLTLDEWYVIIRFPDSAKESCSLSNHSGSEVLTSGEITIN